MSSTIGYDAKQEYGEILEWFDKYPLANNVRIDCKLYVERLNLMLKEADMTAAELARRAGVSAQTVGKILLNEAPMNEPPKVNLDLLKLFAAVLNCTPAYFAGLTDERWGVQEGKPSALMFPLSKTEKKLMYALERITQKRVVRVRENERGAVEIDISRHLVEFIYQLMQKDSGDIHRVKEFLLLSQLVTKREPIPPYSPLSYTLPTVLSEMTNIDILKGDEFG